MAISPFKFLTVLPVVLLLLYCNDNTLTGEWMYIKGYANGKPTFQEQMNRKKHFTKHGGFYISNEVNGAKSITIRGNYSIVDETHFKEFLGDTSVLYSFTIENDTLRFEGNLEIPVEGKTYRNVYVKEVWARCH